MRILTMSVYTAIAGALALGLAAQAGATVITFENDGLAPDAMGNSPGAVVPVASRLTDQYLGLGVLFASEGGFAAVVNHGAGAATPSPPAIIGGTTANGTLSYFAPITITFVAPGNAAVDAVVSSIKVLGDQIPLNSGTVTMTAFDINGVQIGSDVADDVGGIGTGPVLELSIAGIHRVVLTGTSGTVGFDNVEFLGLQVPGAVVPAPGSLALLIGGLGALAAVRRRG